MWVAPHTSCYTVSQTLPSPGAYLVLPWKGETGSGFSSQRANALGRSNWLTNMWLQWCSNGRIEVAPSGDCVRTVARMTDAHTTGSSIAIVRISCLRCGLRTVLPNNAFTTGMLVGVFSMLFEVCRQGVEQRQTRSQNIDGVRISSLPWVWGWSSIPTDPWGFYGDF